MGRRKLAEDLRNMYIYHMHEVHETKNYEFVSPESIAQTRYRIDSGFRARVENLVDTTLAIIDDFQQNQPATEYHNKTLETKLAETKRRALDNASQAAGLKRANQQLQERLAVAGTTIRRHWKENVMLRDRLDDIISLAAEDVG